jgi:RNA polymerase-associated protein CTR9
VIALAKGAYSSTTVPGIQAESLYTLARVHHIRDEMEKANTFYERAIKLAPDLTPARFGLAQTLIWDETYDEAAGHLRLVVGKSPSATDAHATLGLLEAKSGKDRKAAFSYIKKAIDLEPANSDLVLLEALALQQQESDYQQALERYQKALELMESQGNSPSWIILTNMGVLCHETKKYDEAAVCYEKAMKALESDDNGMRSQTHDVEQEVIREKENHLFWDYVDSGVKCSQDISDDSSQSWNLESLNPEIKVGDHVRIGKEFESEVIDVSETILKLKDGYTPSSTDEESQDALPMILFVKRTNKFLSKFSAISIAFNVARLHEATGRTIAAIELHKAIVKRHPSYVNSYLRLACIARDCGSLVNCSEWLKSACAVAPGNPEVLTLVGNLHLSLCDWKPAQSVFNQLLEQKIPNVEAYSMLCLGNIYFNNLKTPGKYAKHLQYAADFYRRILNKDNANAYAANGLGTVLAEKADLTRAKEIFNHVREVSGDSIPDALLNLGHIYLALSKHPEALQMYQSYMERTRSSDAPTSSKSKDEDEAEILLYIAFAYFDWARQTEACNNSKAAPADDRYKHCIEYLEKALKTTKRENLILRYNWCMAKLAAANCVLQKLTRGIRRTAQEVQDALDGLQESLPKVQMMLQWKQERKKVPISTSLMNNFIVQCKANIESAKSHLSEEIRKETEARELRELQKMEILAKQKEKELAELEARRKEAEELEEIERKARMKMEKVTSLLGDWELKAAKAKEESEKRKNKKSKVAEAPQADDENDDVAIPSTSLFDDSSDEETDGPDESNNDTVNKSGRSSELPEAKAKHTESDLFGESDDDDDDGNAGVVGVGDEKNSGENIVEDEEIKEAKVAPSGRDLFGESSSDEESELPPENKRGREEVINGDEKGMAPSKKRRLDDDDDSS